MRGLAGKARKRRPSQVIIRIGLERLSHPEDGFLFKWFSDDLKTNRKAIRREAARN